VAVRAGNVDEAVVELLTSAVGGRGRRLTAAVERYRHDPAAELLLAVLDAKPVGLVGYAVGRAEIQLLHVATSEPLRRRGIGRRLVSAVVDLGLPIVAETDQASVGFYRALGFTVESLGDKYPGVERFAVRRGAPGGGIASPESGLRIDVGSVRLQPPTDAQLEVLARAAATPAAVLSSDEAHFVTWLAGRTPEDVARDRVEQVRFHRDLRRRPGWTLDLAVLVDGDPVGMQSLSGFDQWPVRRVAGTASWLLAPYQHRGIGTYCRAGVLELAFVHFRAEVAKSWTVQENRASIAVSTKLGYHRIAQHRIVDNGREVSEVVFQLDSEDWFRSPARRRYASVIAGAEPVAALLDR
jgi:RimJ/RimL family protein N-acetyltransferase